MKQYEVPQLVRRARNLFWKKGFAGTSLPDLERVTGVNKSGIYSEFESKGDLFAACLRDYSSEVGIFQTLRKEPRGWDNIKKMLIQLGVSENRQGCMIVNSLLESRQLPKGARNVVTEHLSKVAREIDLNLESAGLSGHQVTEVREIIITFSAGLAIQSTQPFTESVQHRIDQFLEMVKVA